jgi:hypothetical protein
MKLTKYLNPLIGILSYGNRKEKLKVNNEDRLKIFYLVAIFGVLFIWVTAMVILEIMKVETDRGFFAQVTGICVLVLTSLVNLIRSQGNANIANDIKETMDKKL